MCSFTKVIDYSYITCSFTILRGEHYAACLHIGGVYDYSMKHYMEKSLNVYCTTFVVKIKDY